MPSGPKKRKAAKRRKEQEQQQQLGVQPPGSPTSPTTGPPSSLQGNGVREEEEDDRMSHDGKGNDSGSDFASPTARGSHNDHQEVGEEEPDDARIEAKREDCREESDPPGSADGKMMGSMVNGGEQTPSDSVAPQKIEEIMTATGEVVAFSALDVKRDEIGLLPPSDPAPHSSFRVPISGPEAVNVEHILSDTNKDHDIAGEVPPPKELKQPEAVDAAKLVEQPVPVLISEEVVQASNVPIEDLVVVDSVAVALSNTNEEKLVSLADATSQQPDPTVVSDPGAGSCEITGSSEVVQPTQLKQRASWMSCCGLFDLIAGDHR